MIAVFASGGSSSMRRFSLDKAIMELTATKKVPQKQHVDSSLVCDPLSLPDKPAQVGV
jgi:hypothetical protein